MVEDPSQQTLVFLAKQQYLCVANGQLKCAIEHDHHTYQHLLNDNLIQLVDGPYAEVYQITHEGWKSLPVRVRRSIVKEYKVWKKRIHPTIADPEFMEWTWVNLW